MSARLAVQAIPGPEAGEALRAAVEKTAGLIKVGIIDSLGARREAAAVATLTKALGDADPLVVGAAGLALGKIGTPKCAQALAAVADKVPAAARPTFKEPSVRLAAWDALGQVGDASAVSTLLAAMAAEGPAAAMAQRSLLRLKDPAVDQKIAAALQEEKVPAWRAELVTVLAARQAKAAVPIKTGSIHSGDGSRFNRRHRR